MKKSHDNISPLDSRYASKIEDTRTIFSEANLTCTVHIHVNENQQINDYCP